jgi:hypothetical protein
MGVSRAGVLAGPIAAAAVLAAFWCLLMASVRDKSPTYDEIGHATAGYTYWRLNDYRMDPENGNLPQRVIALPFLAAPGRFPPTGGEAWRTANFWDLGEQWFFQSGNDPAALLARGRAAASAFAVALGALVWIWSRRLFGPAGGMLSLLLYVLNPTVLANGALMASDTAASLFFLAATLGWWLSLHRISPVRLLASALAAGALFVSKASAGLIIPIAIALAIARLIDGRPLALAVGGTRLLHRRWHQAAAIAAVFALHGLAVIAFIWGSFGFRFSPFAGPNAAGGQMRSTWEAVVGTHPPPASRMLLFADRHRLLPDAYLFGQAYSLHFSRLRSSFLNGRIGLFGWASFFPYTFLSKTPLPLFGVMGIAALAAASRLWSRRGATGPPPGTGVRALLYPALPLLLLIVAYGCAFLVVHVDIGHRHIMPLYPPLFVLCGAAAGALHSRSLRLALAALVLLLAAEAWAVFPNYLAYFNALSGGPAEGYRHLVDSSFDWGQELPAIKAYAERHGGEGRVYLSYFGSVDPANYRIRAQILYSWFKPFQLRKFPADRAAELTAGFLRLHPGFQVAADGDGPGGRIVMFLAQPAQLRLRGGTYLISATMLQPVTYTPGDGPWGPWNARYEARYQFLRRRAAPILSDDENERYDALRTGTLDDWIKTMNDFDEFRFARLTAYLRRRIPDDQINYSILVYRLSDADIRAALDGPPAELGPDVPIDLLSKALANGG